MFSFTGFRRFCSAPREASVRRAGAAGVALVSMVAVTTPAAADIWWETELGTLYWEDVVKNNGVFKFLDEQNEIKDSLGFFIDGLASQYSNVGVKPGTYRGTWYLYGKAEAECRWRTTDPYGKRASYWGTLSITFHQDYNYFTADLSACNGRTKDFKLNGTPGQ